MFSRDVLATLMDLPRCSSTQWCKPSCGDCHHCFRLLYQRLTIDGKVKHRKTGRVNYRLQRRRILRWYRRTKVAQATYSLDWRVLKSLGINQDEL